MNADRIRNTWDISDLKELVSQFEELPELTAQDIGPLVLPLTRKTSHPKFAEDGAILTEKILISILSRLPSVSAAPSKEKDPGNLPYPTNALYNRTIIAWGNTRSPRGAERAQRIFQLMVDLHRQDPSNHTAVPCRKTFKSLLRAWAVSNSPDGPAKSYEILKLMEDMSGVTALLEDNGESTAGRIQRRGSALAMSVDFLGEQSLDPPDLNTYNAVLSAYGRVDLMSHPHALTRIAAIARHMDKLYKLTASKEFALDPLSFYTILRAISKFTAFSTTPMPPNIIVDVEKVLRRMHSNHDMQKILLTVDLPRAYGVAVEVLLKTEPLVENLQRAHDYVLAMAGKRDPRDLESIPVVRHRGLYPASESIYKVIQAWEGIGLPEAESRIDELVRIAVETPFSRHYELSKEMDTWIQTGWEHAPELVEKMLEHAWQRRDVSSFYPCGIAFANGIKAWLRSNDDDAPHRAELLFEKMISLHEETNHRHYVPRDVHVRFVQTAWLSKCETGLQYDGQGGHLYPAEHIEANLHRWRGSSWMKNLSGHYSMAIRAWAKQRVGPEDDEPCPLHRAIALLHELEEFCDVLPPFPCNWVLEACTRYQETLARRKEAYQIGLDIFSRCQRNARTYVLMIQLFLAQVGNLDDQHLEAVEVLFRDCCARGMLTQEMIWHVVEVVSVDSIQKLFGVSYQYADFIVKNRREHLNIGRDIGWQGGPPTALLLKNLPEAWHNNVTGRKQKSM